MKFFVICIHWSESWYYNNWIIFRANNVYIILKEYNENMINLLNFFPNNSITQNKQCSKYHNWISHKIYRNTYNWILIQAQFSHENLNNFECQCFMPYFNHRANAFIYHVMYQFIELWGKWTVSEIFNYCIDIDFKISFQKFCTNFHEKRGIFTMSKVVTITLYSHTL